MTEYEATLDPRRRRAVDELTELVQAHFPLSGIMVAPGEDNPDATHVIATVDIDDPDDVVDLVMERMLELQLDEGIPVYLIPIRTPERTTRMREQQHQNRNHPLVSFPPHQP